jgi:L-serine dehydratase
MTGHGHATDLAVLLGLLGKTPDVLDPDTVPGLIEEVRSTGKLNLAGQREIAFNEETDLLFLFGESLPEHPNGIRFFAYDSDGIVISEQTYFSVGGGFVLAAEEMTGDAIQDTDVKLPYPFESAVELLAIGERTGLSIAEIVLENEKVWRDRDETKKGVLRIWEVMNDCIERGCQQTGILPGGLKVRRRAHDMRQALISRPEEALKDQLSVLDWVNLYALAVNEENAAGGRVVTAPTNGAAGVIPAVLAYYVRFVPGANEQGIIDFMATAAAIGMLYKKNASISAAEVGCQGEVGVACSMAAGGLTHVLGGNNAQIENAAEIGMEHNLGLTCDPIGGLVQIPCIERNTMGAIKAINAARLALRGDGSHYVPLDSVIKTMFETGKDMQDKYKETSEGGLAVNVVEC